jgi:hypothetical protein
MTARSLFVLAFAAALLVSFGCGGGGGNGGTPAPALACSDSGTAGANAITMSCGGATGGTTELVNIVMGGPAASTTDVRGFNLDVAYDPAKLEFVPAASYTSPPFGANALILVTLENGVPGKVVVSIQQVSGDPPASFPAGETVVLGLSFRTVSGIAVAPTPVTFENAEATNASATVSFASSLMLSYQ